MSVLIKGMEMPKDGTVIAIYKLNGQFYASMHGTELCPLVLVPSNGRLIDADAAIALIQEEKIKGETLDIIIALGDGLQAETLNQACDRHIKIINSLPVIDV